MWFWGEEIQTHNFSVYDINKVIMQTKKYYVFIAFLFHE